jgi:hypothetical protein
MTAVALKESYIRLLRDCLLDNIYKNQKACDHDGTILRDATECEIQTGTVWPDRAHTMIGYIYIRQACNIKIGNNFRKLLA